MVLRPEIRLELFSTTDEAQRLPLYIRLPWRPCVGLKERLARMVPGCGKRRAMGIDIEVPAKARNSGELLYCLLHGSRRGRVIRPDGTSGALLVARRGRRPGKGTG